MKRIFIAVLFISHFGFAQDTNIKEKKYDVNNRKGQFFASWGWNRSSYSKSDISFKGNDFNFTVHNAKASDKPKPFGIDFFDPLGITLPATNLELGYFIKDNYTIVLGYDHMKYVMRNNQDARISGTIAVGDYDYNGTTYNYDGTYNNTANTLPSNFLLFEHTDGLNYIFVGGNRFDNFNKFLRITTHNFEVNLEEGVDLGFLMPRTNTTILGNKRYDEFHVAGFGFSASAGLNLTFFKHFYIKADLKVGYINMPDIRITSDSSEKAKQHFTFTESAYTFGYRFRIQ